MNIDVFFEIWQRCFVIIFLCIFGCFGIVEGFWRFLWILLLFSMILEMISSGWRFYEEFGGFFLSFLKFLKIFGHLLSIFFVDLDRFWKFSWNFCRFFWILLLCSMILEIILSGWRFYEKISGFFLHFSSFLKIFGDLLTILYAIWIIFLQFLWILLYFWWFRRSYKWLKVLWRVLWRFLKIFGDSWSIFSQFGTFLENSYNLWIFPLSFEWFLEIFGDLLSIFSQFWSFLDKFWRIFRFLWVSLQF